MLQKSEFWRLPAAAAADDDDNDDDDDDDPCLGQLRGVASAYECASTSMNLTQAKTSITPTGEASRWQGVGDHHKESWQSTGTPAEAEPRRAALSRGGWRGCAGTPVRGWARIPAMIRTCRTSSSRGRPRLRVATTAPGGGQRRLLQTKGKL